MPFLKRGRDRVGRTVGVLAITLLLISSGKPTYAQTSSGKASPSGEGPASKRLWQFGAFFAGGFVPRYQVHTNILKRTVELNLFNAGFEAGRMVTGFHGAGIFRGRGESMVEVIPFWLGDYPRQTQSVYVFSEPSQGWGSYRWGPYQRFGASITPLLFRWNFEHNEETRHFQPWAQLGGGLLWTNHKFPLLGGSTSVINFTPQVGIGENIFVRKDRSLEFAMKFVHISNAGLADNDPGLDITLQFSVGYFWWK